MKDLGFGRTLIVVDDLTDELEKDPELDLSKIWTAGRHSGIDIICIFHTFPKATTTFGEKIRSGAKNIILVDDSTIQSIKKNEKTWVPSQFEKEFENHSRKILDLGGHVKIHIDRNISNPKSLEDFVKPIKAFEVPSAQLITGSDDVDIFWGTRNPNPTITTPAPAPAPASAPAPAPAPFPTFQNDSLP